MVNLDLTDHFSNTWAFFPNPWEVSFAWILPVNENSLPPNDISSSLNICSYLNILLFVEPNSSSFPFDSSVLDQWLHSLLFVSLKIWATCFYPYPWPMILLMFKQPQIFCTDFIYISQVISILVTLLIVFLFVYIHLKNVIFQTEYKQLSRCTSPEESKPFISLILDFILLHLV